MITASSKRISVHRLTHEVRPTPTASSPVEMKGYQTRSETTVHGWSAVLLGIPFLGFGVFFVLIATGVIYVRSSSMKSSPEVLALAGLAFGLPGFMLITHGLRGLIRKQRVARLRFRYPDEPWFADYPWNSDGIRDMQGRRIFTALTGLIYMGVFSAPMNYIAFVAAKSLAMKLFVLFTLDSFVAIFGIVFVYRLMRRVKQGPAMLRFDRFPFHPGETMSVRYDPGRFPEGVPKLTCTLRCVREAYETRPGYKRKTEVVVPYCLHEQTVWIDASRPDGWSATSAAISFAIPADATGTALSDRPPTYWELEVSAKTPGIDLNTRFLIPIYDRCASHSHS